MRCRLHPLITPLSFFIFYQARSSRSNEKVLPLHHFDVAQAYIRASLDEEEYRKLPGGCGKQSKRTAKLGKSIYGPKQSGRK